MPNSPRIHRRAGHAEYQHVDLRPSSHSRGYDGDWRRLREWYALRHPLCEDCLLRDRVVPLQEVDHVREFNGRADPLRLDPNNLRSLCRSCHRRKHAASQGDGGV